MKPYFLELIVSAALLVGASARSATTVSRSGELVKILVSAPDQEPRSPDTLDVTLKKGQRLSVRAEARWTIGMSVTSTVGAEDCLKPLGTFEIKAAEGRSDEYRRDFLAVATGRATVYVVYEFRDATWGATKIDLSIVQ